MNITAVVPRRNSLDGIIRTINNRRPDIIVEVVCGPHLPGQQRLSGKIRLSLQIIINFLYYSFHAKRLFRKSDVILLNGLVAALPFLFINSFGVMRRKSARIVVTSFFLHGLATSAAVRKLLTYLFSDRRISLVAQTKIEVEYFSKLMDKSQIAYIPFCIGRVRFNAEAGAGSSYIFSGGYSNRDYYTLLQVAKRIPCDFILAVSRLNKIDNLPDNVRVLRDISIEDFNGYIKNSLFVIVPLKEDVGSSGQMVALTAMSLGKAVIYTDIGCISDYFSPGKTGLPYALNNSENLYEATTLLIRDQDVRDAIGRNAQKAMNREFTWERYSRDLVELLIA